MQSQIGKTVSVLVEENNTGRTPDDIDIKVLPCGGVSQSDEGGIPNKTICNVKITGVENDVFVGEQHNKD